MTRKRDRLDEAIAAADQGPDWSRNVDVPVLIRSTNRPVMLNVPIDLGDDELLELLSWLTHPAAGLRPYLARQAAGISGRIIVPS